MACREATARANFHPVLGPLGGCKKYERENLSITQPKTALRSWWGGPWGEGKKEVVRTFPKISQKRIFSQKLIEKNVAKCRVSEVLSLSIKARDGAYDGVDTLQFEFT